MILGRYLVDVVRPSRRHGRATICALDQAPPFGRVSIKIHPVPCRESDFRALSPSEHPYPRVARILERLDHPGVVRLVDLAHHGDHPALVLRWVEGTPLIRAPLASLPVAERLRASIDLAETVAYLQERRVLHRDIKPHNLIWRTRVNTPSLVLVDFDAARGDEGGLLENVGTLGWAAPEHATQRACGFDRGLDLYALGATLHFLLTGRPVFAGEDVLATQSLTSPEDLLGDSPSLVPGDPGASETLRQLLLALLQPVPDDRCQDADQVVRILRDVSSGRPRAASARRPSRAGDEASSRGEPRAGVEDVQRALSAGDLAAAERVAASVADPRNGHGAPSRARALALLARIYLRVHRLDSAITAADQSIELARRVATDAQGGDTGSASEELADVVTNAWLTVAYACRARGNKRDLSVSLDALHSAIRSGPARSRPAEPPFADLIELELSCGRASRVLRQCLRAPDRGQLATLVRALREVLRDRAFLRGWADPRCMLRGTAADPDAPYWCAVAIAALVSLWRGGAQDHPRPGESRISRTGYRDALTAAVEVLEQHEGHEVLLDCIRLLSRACDGDHVVAEGVLARLRDGRFHPGNMPSLRRVSAEDVLVRLAPVPELAEAFGCALLLRHLGCVDDVWDVAPNLDGSRLTLATRAFIALLAARTERAAHLFRSSLAAKHPSRSIAAAIECELDQDREAMVEAWGLGIALCDLGEFEDGLACLRAVHERVSTHASASWLAQGFVAAGEPHRCGEIVSDLSGDDRDLRLARWAIWAACADGHIEAAVDQAMDAASGEPPSVAGHAAEPVLTRTLIAALEWVARTTERTTNNAGLLREVMEWLTRLDRAPLHMELLAWLYGESSGDPDDLERLALGYQMSGDPDAALSLFREARVRGGATAGRDAAFVDHLLLAGRFEEAREVCARALETDSDHSDLWRLLGEAECRLRRWQRAFDAALRARQLGGASAATAVHVAEALLELGRPGEARPFATEALGRGSELDWDVYVRVLRALDAPDVLSEAQLGLDRHPRSALLWCQLAEIHLAAGRVDDAREAAGMAWGLGAASPRCAALVCRLLIDHGAPVELAQAAAACARLGDEAAELALRTRLAARSRDPARTIELGLQAVARDPRRASCWQDLYEAWLAIGDLDQAFMAAGMLDRIGGGPADYARRCCLIAACDAPAGPALEAARRAVEKAPDDRELALVRGLLLLHDRRADDADRMLGRIAVDEPLIPTSCTAVALGTLHRSSVDDAVEQGADVESRFWAQAMSSVGAGNYPFAAAVIDAASARGIETARLAVLGALARHGTGESSLVEKQLAEARTLPHGDVHVDACARLLVALGVRAGVG